MSERKFRHRTLEGKFRLLATFIFYLHLAGLTLIHSNGQVEGQVTRIKLIKRMMFGRAGFALLRQRVLHAL
jgi:transposase